MSPRAKSIAMILSVGFFVLASTIIGRGGFVQAWDENNGGIVIIVLAMVGLTIRALIKPENQTGAADTERS